MSQRYSLLSLGLFAMAVIVAGKASAQDNPDAERFFPRQGFMLSGYGGAGYSAILLDDETPNNFSAIFAPIMLFQISDRFLFEGEFEFELEEGVTETSLEYAQIDVSINNNFTLMAGKFLLPFNTFSERMHPTWINKFISNPALYVSHAGIASADPLLPVLSDIGVQLRGAFSTGRFSTITTEVYVTQGPVLAVAEHDEGDEAVPKGSGGAGGEFFANKAASVGGGGGESGTLAFGGNSPDNNENKMVGGRLGFGVAPYFEVNLSGMTAAYDDLGDLRFSALGVHLEGRSKSISLYGEFIQTWQDVEDHEESPLAKNQTESASLNEEEIGSLTRSGYWFQLGYRWKNWQPGLRWTQVFEGELDGEHATEGGRQLALGLDHWFEPALVLKFEYLINFEEESITNNGLAVQLSFGF